MRCFVAAFNGERKMSENILYGEIQTRTFATHMEGDKASGFVSADGTKIVHPRNEHDGQWQHIVPDTYIEVFAYPGAAWWLYTFPSEEYPDGYWTERDYPEDWQG